MGFPFAPRVRDLQRDYVRFVLSRATISRNSSPRSIPIFFSNKHSHRGDLISSTFKTKVNKVCIPSNTFFLLFFSLPFRREGGGKFLNTHGVIYYGKKDGMEKLLSYSLTLHCDLLSGSREPLAHPAGEGPRTIRT